VRRGRLLAVAGVPGAFVAAVVLVALVGGGADAPAPPRPLAVSTSMAPAPVFFGDIVTGHAEVLVDRQVIDPDRVRIGADFAPYSLVGPQRESRSNSGRLSSIDVRYTLVCLVEACLPARDGIALPKLRVSAPFRDGGTATTSAAWPRVNVVSRVEPTALETDPPPWRQQLAFPPVSYRVRPGLLAALLTLGAAVLAVSAFALFGLEITRRRRLLLERARFRSTLARALDLARASASRGPDDRRRALALLARVLAFDPNGGRRLAPAASRLAWGRTEPSPTGLASLVEEIERTVSTR
jgi:hypothetical protein